MQPKTMSPPGARPARLLLLPWCTALALLLAPAASSQATAGGRDAVGPRDRVECHDGTIHVGRVWRPFDPDEILILDGGKRTRIRTRDVARLDVVADRMAEFLARRAQRPQGATRSYDWILVEWAITKGLPHMAQLTAIELLLQDPDHEPARILLGHRRQGKNWLWPAGSDFMTLAALDQRHGSFGRARELRSEHFLLRSDAPLATVVPLLFDLETLYASWVKRFGARMNLSAVLEPIRIHLHRDPLSFPAWNLDRRAYYEPPGVGDTCHTYVDEDVVRRTLAIAVQPLLYRTLADNFTAIDARHHVCTWLEIGLGGYFAQSFTGPSGRLEARKPSLADEELALASRSAKVDLKNLIHLHYRRVYATDAVAKSAFGLCPALVHFLMRPEHGLEDRFMDYIQQVFRDGKGDSSTTFDRALQVTPEELEPRFTAWLRGL